MSEPKDEKLTPEQLARRKLLAMTAYVAPAILGTLLVGRTASAQARSCLPFTCPPATPCAPGTPCKPRR